MLGADCAQLHSRPLHSLTWCSSCAQLAHCVIPCVILGSFSLPLPCTEWEIAAATPTTTTDSGVRPRGFGYKTATTPDHWFIAHSAFAWHSSVFCLLFSGLRPRLLFLTCCLLDLDFNFRARLLSRIWTWRIFAQFLFNTSRNCSPLQSLACATLRFTTQLAFTAIHLFSTLLKSAW